MSEPIDDGGSAFPVPNIIIPQEGHYTTNPAPEPGMSLRDWFAGQAAESDIQEYLPATMGELAVFKDKHGFRPTREWARYQFADAMLLARKEKP